METDLTAAQLTPALRGQTADFRSWHWMAAAHGRQEPGELKVNAAILERQVVEKILKNLTLWAAGCGDWLQWVRPPKLRQEGPSNEPLFTNVCP